MGVLGGGYHGGVLGGVPGVVGIVKAYLFGREWGRVIGGQVYRTITYIHGSKASPHWSNLASNTSVKPPCAAVYRCTAFGQPTKRH